MSSMADKQEVPTAMSTSSPASTATEKSPKTSGGGSATKRTSHARRKRPPKRLSHKPNDIYVNRNSQFGAQLARCHRLFDQGCSELTIHGLGAAIHRAINLALQLKETSSSSIDVFATTSTVELVDDLEPLNDDADYQTQTRPNSAIHIRLSKLSPSTSPLPTPTHHTLSTPSLPSQQADIERATGKDNKSQSVNEQESFVSQRTNYKSISSKTL